MPKMDLPLPKFPEPDTEPFWDATKDGKLTYQVCDDCNGIVWHPRRHCTHCTSLNLSWKESKGEGTVYTYSIVRQNYHPAFRERIPYVIAWVDLDEGFRMLSNIVDVAPEEVAIGQRVRVRWLEADGLALPAFRPA